MSFAGFGSNASTPAQPSPEKIKSAIIQRIQTEAAMTNARALIGAINGNCFEKCFPQPGSSTSSSEKACVTSCMEKYMAAWNAVAKVYLARVQSEGVSRF